VNMNLDVETFENYIK